MMMKSTIAVSLASVLALTGCESTTTNIQDPNYRARNGAATGAVIGGLLGASTAHSDRHRLGATLLGAAAGGLLGGAIGSNLDTQAADLRSRLGNPNVAFGQIEIVGVSIAEPRLVTRLVGQPDKERSKRR